MRLTLEREGLDALNDVTIVPLGSADQRLPALLSGAVDAVLLTPPDNIPAGDAGFRTLVDVSSLDIPGDVSGLVVRKSWLATHHDLMQRFIDAEIQAIAFAKNNPNRTLEIMRANIKYPDERMFDTAYNYFYQGSDPVIPSQPFPRLEQFKDSVAQLSKTNASVGAFDLSQLIDTSFVQSAIDRGLDK
jgi:ABC-type nitrate/sulfonate/bicarbonate transport system substrate-binding protein